MWNPDTKSNFQDSAEAASYDLSRFLLIQGMPVSKVHAMWNPDTKSNFQDSAEAASYDLSRFLLIQGMPDLKTGVKTAN